MDRNTGRLNWNLCVIFKFNKRPKTLGITFKKMAFCERNQLFVGDFNAVLDDWIIKILKQHAIPNSCFQKVKDLLSEGCRKTIQRWIMSSSKVSNFQRKISLQIMGFCFVWWIFLLLKVLHKVYCTRCYKVNNAQTFKNLVVSFYVLHSQMLLI